MNRTRTLITLLSISAMLLIGGGMFVSTKVHALSGVDFSAARIIDDSVFFNSSTQNITDIQNFLNAKVPTCDTNGTQPSTHAGYATRADWGRANGVPPPYTCLKDYSQTIGNIAADSYCGAIGGGAKSGANLIYDVARACGVNTQTLLVLLQKEQSLITDDWPWPGQYQKATGYGCPDTAACDSQYYGFFNQIYNAAHQFKKYTQLPQNYNYASGRTSYVLYNPNSSCGGSNLTIQNAATAALYNYTPYQPNQAALNNLYGSGDSCSAYGNRNFWRLFNDWFGPTLGDLVRTPDNATVYLISGDMKYPIGDGSVLSDYGALGPIRYVTNEYIGLKTTGSPLGHMVGSSGGTIYFVNAGIKLPFSSCSLVTEYGYSCGQVNYLTDGQLTRLVDGPLISQLYQTTSGKEFYISGGQKHEVFDQPSLTQQGISGSVNTLLESGISYLSYGTPVARDGVVAVSRLNGWHYFYDTNRFIGLDGDFARSLNFANLTHAYLDDASITVPQRLTGFNGFMKNSSSSTYYVTTTGGKVALTSPSNWTANFTTVSDTYLSNSTSNSDNSINNMLIKSPSNATVYYVTNGKKRPIPSWGDLASLKVSPLQINTMPTRSINSIPDGPIMYGAGSVVKSSSSATVYIVRSATELYPLSSFVYPGELGINSSLRTMSDNDFQTYTVLGTLIKNKIQCNSNDYVATNGSLHQISSTLLADYGYNQSDFLDVGTNLCQNLLISSQSMDKYDRVNNGTIYYISGGQKRAFSSYSTYVASGGSGTNTLNVSDFLVGSIASGPNM